MCATSCAAGQVCVSGACSECYPGTSENSTEGCDSCQHKERYCSGQAKWGAWTSCINECLAAEVCWEGKCEQCVPYTMQETPCTCGTQVRYCLPDASWGPYSACESYCAAGWQCENGVDCYTTYAPSVSWGGQAWCGSIWQETAFVSLYCQAGDYCLSTVCRTYQYKKPGTKYTPYPSAGGPACGQLIDNGVQVFVFCKTGDTCSGSFCTRN